jgi:bacterioferritin
MQYGRHHAGRVRLPRVKKRRHLSRQFGMIKESGMSASQGLTDIKTLRQQARDHAERGAVTAGYSADRESVIALLNDALATEIVCVLRYRRHHFMARGIHAKSTADEFLAHANEELGHADLLAERIVQLGGEPDFSPDSLSDRSHAEYVPGGALTEMIQEDLVAERIAIDSYREFIHYLGEDDSTTCLMLKRILSMEEKHADEMADLLEAMPAGR